MTDYPQTANYIQLRTTEPLPHLIASSEKYMCQKLWKTSFKISLEITARFLMFWIKLSVFWFTGFRSILVGFFSKDRQLEVSIYVYIRVMSVLPVWVLSKTHFANPPGGVRYLVGAVSEKEIDPWKKIPLRARRAPAARRNLLRSLHRQSPNDFLELHTNKIR